MQYAPLAWLLYSSGLFGWSLLLSPRVLSEQLPVSWDDSIEHRPINVTASVMRIVPLRQPEYGQSTGAERAIMAPIARM